MRDLNQTPTGRAFTTAGQLGGGFYVGPGSPLRAVAALPSAASRAGRDFAMASGRSVSPLTVFHGSPHKFDKFDSAKIGTGEGNQSYGRGLYLAQAPDVAKQYQKIGEVTSIGGKPVAVSGSGAFDAPDGISKDAINFLGSNNWNVKSSLDELGKAYGESKTVGDKAFYMDLIRQVKQIPQGKIKSTGGNFYTVDLPDEKIAQMLDWDKPLGEQSEAVKAAIEKTKLNLPSNAIDDLGGDLSLMYGPDVTPSEFLNTWESLGKNAGGELALREAGIPGIRYLDQQSRNAGQFSITPPSGTVSGKWMVKGTDYNSSGIHFDTEAEAIAKLKEMNADATRNFVVFPGEEEALTILKRNDEDLSKLLKRDGDGMTKLLARESDPLYSPHATNADPQATKDLFQFYEGETYYEPPEIRAEKLNKLYGAFGGYEQSTRKFMSPNTARALHEKGMLKVNKDDLSLLLDMTDKYGNIRPQVPPLEGYADGGLVTVLATGNGVPGGLQINDYNRLTANPNFMSETGEFSPPEGFSPGGAVQGYQAGGAVKAAKAAAKNIGELVRKYTAPQDEALVLAQQRAALPVEKGGLGLPANNTAAQRAKAMGFDTPAYKTNAATVNDAPLEVFQSKGSPIDDYVGKDGGFSGFFAQSPDVANKFAWQSNSASFPVMLDMSKAKQLEAAGKKARDFQFSKKADPKDFEALQSGLASKYGAVLSNTADEGTIYIPKSSDQIRSRFAAFDPWRKSAATAAAMGVAAPDLLAGQEAEVKKAGGGQVRGYAAGGMVSAPDFADDFDPARIGSIVAELHALNAG
jgi:hypothetical protein